MVFQGASSAAESAAGGTAGMTAENLDTPRGAPPDATVLLVQTPEQADLTAQLFEDVAAVLTQ